MFAFQESRGSVEVAFTDRLGGQAQGVLDLAEPKPGDEPGEYDRLQESIDVVAHALARGGEAATADPFELVAGTPLPTVVRMRQVHGPDVHLVDRAWLDERHSEPPEADGLVTDVPGAALLVRVADCIPVLLADVERRVVGAAHAGRLGLVAGIVPATVARMRERGAEEVVAWLGPRVCGRCYEVPADMRDEVAAVLPETFTETSWGTPALDIGAGVVAQLRKEGVEVVDVARCTLEDDDLFSHRREGAAAGRLGGLVWVRP